MPRYFLSTAIKPLCWSMWSFFRHPKLYKKALVKRMSWKNIIFDGKKINNSIFYKNKKVFNIYDIMLIKY